MDFDRSHDYFACVGVTKKIKIYDFNVIVDFSRQQTTGCGGGGGYHQTIGTATTQMDTNYPIFEMQHTSKLSCISWNKYFKNQIACSDYDGAVTLWDSEQGTLLKTYQEHEKRCWGVEFSNVDPRIFASASDDTKVKLWSTNNDYSISSIDAKSNVCCVTFKPDSKFHLIFGTADHSIHYYDLRNTKEPIRLFKAHRKAVSYVKFSNQDEFISASTDSSLKLWNLNEGQCLTSFHGHTNEKNFVGLTVNDAGYIATGGCAHSALP
jgi:E3 ubiquitin-protein ligase RFWD2